MGEKIFNIKIDGKIFSVQETVFKLIEKLENQKNNTLEQLKTEEKAHKNCFDRYWKLKDSLKENK